MEKFSLSEKQKAKVMGVLEDEMYNRMKARRAELKQRNTAREDIEAEEIGIDKTVPLSEEFERIMIDTFETYFRNRNIEIDSLKFTKIPSAVYNDAFRECKKSIELETAQRIDKDNLYVMYHLSMAYKSIVSRYAMVAHPINFCFLTGISLNTFDRWGTNQQKTIVYVDPDTGKSFTESTVQFFKEENRERLREVLTPSPREIYKEVHEIYKAGGEQRLNESALGLTVNANNSKRMGLEYAKNAMIETAQVQRALGAGELPKLALNSEDS